MAIKTFLSNGQKVVSVKSMNPWEVDDNTGWSNEEANANLIELVPILYASWQIRSKALSDVPFCIYNMKGDEVDNSDDYQNVVGFMPDPKGFLWMSEAALCGMGQCYWFNERNRVKTLSLRYWKPASVIVNLDPNIGLKGFTRTWTGGQKDYEPEDVLYTWLPDPSVEIGPPTAWPVLSALSTAGTVGAINRFVLDFMNRGAVKAFLLSVSGNPPKSETEKLEKTWNSAGGLKGLLWRAFNKDKVEPVIVGEGLEALKGVTIVDTLQKQVLQAMGVPASKVLANAANYATAKQDDKAFYQQTIIPDTNLIAESLNNQILNKMGYYIEFEPERMEAFQTEENTRAAAVASYVSAISASPEAAVIAFAILGVDVPEDVQKMIDQLTAKKQEAAAQVQEQTQQEPEPEVEEEPEEDETQKSYLEDLDKWKRKAVKRIGKDTEFYSEIIPPDIQVDIHEGLVKCVTKEDVKALFVKAQDTKVAPQETSPADYIMIQGKQILEGMRAELAQIKQAPAPFNLTVHNHPGEAPVVNVQPAEVKAEFPAPVVNVTNEPPQVTVENKIEPDTSARDIAKAIKKLADEK